MDVPGGDKSHLLTEQLLQGSLDVVSLVDPLILLEVMGSFCLRVAEPLHHLMDVADGAADHLSHLGWVEVCVIDEVFDDSGLW